MPDLSTSQQSLNKVVKECGSCKDEVFLFFFFKIFWRFAFPHFIFCICIDGCHRRTLKKVMQHSGRAYAASKDYAYNSETETIVANDKADLAEAWEGHRMWPKFGILTFDILWLLSISVLFVVFAFIPQVEMEHAESWEDYELQLACWSMFSKPLFKFLLRFKIQHMCSIPLPHSCAAYLSMKTYENQGRCSPCLRLLWSELRDGFTTSDPHIDSHHFECLFHCAAAFCTSKSCHKLGWLKHGWFSWDTLDMKWWLPGWISRYQRWIGIQKAAASIFFCCCWILLKLVFFFPPRQQGDVGVTMDPGQ